MRTIQGNMLLSLRSVKSFLDVNADKLSGVVTSGSRQRLDEAIDELATHAAVQTGETFASQSATKRQRYLRRVLLRDHMTPIARIAKLELPDTEELLPLRKPKGVPTTERLAAAAYGMGKAAAPYSNTFITAGLPADFVAKLDAATAAMVQTLSDRSQSRGRVKGATSGLQTKLATGRKIVNVLDAFVRSALADDPSLLAEWNRVKRVPKAGVRSGSGVAGGIAPSPVTAPVTSPVAASA